MRLGPKPCFSQQINRSLEYVTYIEIAENTLPASSVPFNFQPRLIKHLRPLEYELAFKIKSYTAS